MKPPKILVTVHACDRDFKFTPAVVFVVDGNEYKTKTSNKGIESLFSEDGLMLCGKLWTLEAGVPFLTRLPLMLRGTYLFATMVDETGDRLVPKITKSGSVHIFKVSEKKVKTETAEKSFISYTPFLSYVEKEKAEVGDVHNWEIGPHIKIKEPNIWVPVAEAKQHMAQHGVEEKDLPKPTLNLDGPPGTRVLGTTYQHGHANKILNAMLTADLKFSGMPSDASLTTVYMAKIGNSTFFVKPETPLLELNIEEPGGGKFLDSRQFFGGASSGDRHTNEAAAYDIDKFLGLDVVPATVVRELPVPKGVTDASFPDYVVQYYKAEQTIRDLHEGAPSSVQQGVGQHDLAARDDLEPQAMTSDDGQKIAVLDYISGMVDRHKGNIRISTDQEGYLDRVYAIDHGFMMPTNPEEFFVQRVGGFINELSETRAQMSAEVKKIINSIDKEALTDLLLSYGYSAQAVGFARHRVEMLKLSASKKINEWHTARTLLDVATSGSESLKKETEAVRQKQQARLKDKD